MKIVVLGGGLSTERNVALATSNAVCKALRAVGHKAIFVDMFIGLENYTGNLEDVFDVEGGFCRDAVVEENEPDIETVKASRKLQSKSRLGKNVLEVCSMADCVFLGLHGEDGEDGKIQATLDLMGIPYTGSGSLGSAIAMDKAMTKRVMESYGIKTPSWVELDYNKCNIRQIAEELPVPCVIKAVNGGSSIGVMFADSREEVYPALESVFKYSSRVVVEQKIVGREYTQPVLGDTYLSAIEIIAPEGGSFDYISKYQGGAKAAQEICPADITEEVQKLLGETALKIHNALGLSVYSRTDFILDNEGCAWCLEVNTLPGMTANSLIPKAARVAGMSYEQLCEKIIELSLKK